MIHGKNKVKYVPRESQLLPLSPPKKKNQMLGFREWRKDIYNWYTTDRVVGDGEEEVGTVVLLVLVVVFCWEVVGKVRKEGGYKYMGGEKEEGEEEGK